MKKTIFTFLSIITAIVLCSISYNGVYGSNSVFVGKPGNMDLVDQDVNAYMEGTLEFIYPGDIKSGVNIVPFISKKQNDFY